MLGRAWSVIKSSPKAAWGVLVSLAGTFLVMLMGGFILSRKGIAHTSMTDLPDPEDVPIPDVDLGVGGKPFDDYQEEVKDIVKPQSASSVIDDLNSEFD